MWFSKVLMIVLITAFTLTALDAIAADVVYRWVDDQGVVHFGDRPAESANAEVVDIQPGNTVSSQPASARPASDVERDSIYQQPAEPSRAQQRRDERAIKRQEAAVLADAIAAGCKQRRQIVSQLEPSTRVMVRGKDGEVYRMDDNERLEALGEAKSYIARNCSE